MARKPPQYLEGRLSRAATVGEYFAAELLEPAGLTRIEVDWPEDADLTFEQDKKTKAWIISGTVHTAKMYEFIFRGTINNADVAVNLRLPASPDPWTIWKDLPVDWDSLPYPKADTDSARLESDVLMIAASRRGRSHAHKALPRDDDMRLYHDVDSGWHIMTVADGAGSAKFSRFGSQTAVETAITELPHLLQTHLPDPDNATDLTAALYDSLGTAAGNAADAIDDVARSSGRRLRDFSTTLIVGIARKVTDGWFFASISVGDGMIGVIGDDNPLMMSPDNGEFAGQTTFLRASAFADKASVIARIHHRTLPAFTAFMAMTDGVSDPWFPSDIAATKPETWTGLLDQIGEAAQDEDALLDWLNFKIKGEHDDRTIAIMFPNETQA